MPRDVTTLAGKNILPDQIPVSLVKLEITGDVRRYHDLAEDVSLFLDPSTNAVSMASGSGLEEFVAHAGLRVPQIEESEEQALSDVTIEVANVNGSWFTVMANNAYREQPATIWQGNLVLPVGTNPNAVTFQGAVNRWSGRIETINATKMSATLSLSPHMISWAMAIPRHRYTAPTYKHLPGPNAKVRFGSTVVTL